MSQNSDSNNGSNNGAVGGRLVSRREEGEELVDFATGLRGKYTMVRVNARPVAVSQSENIADSRASWSNVGVAAEAARDALVQAREVPLHTEFSVVVAPSALTRFGGYPNEFIPIQPMDEEFVPASNVQENRLSAPVQTVKQETQENRESASGQQATSTQDTSTGSQQWPEQTPSQYQLRLRQRRERHARREQEGQLRPRGAQQGRRDFGRRNPLQSTTEAVEAYAQKLREACESLNEADRMFNQLARANRGRANRGLGAMAPIRIPESFRRAAARTQPNHGSIAASDAQQQRPSARPDARHQKPNDPRPNRGGNNVKICGNCGKDGHVLAQCVHPSEDGFVHGCSTCNKNDHESLDMCPFRPTNAIKLFTRAVLERQNRPPLAQYKDWIPLAEAVPAGRLPQAFPWMPGFLSTLLDLPAGSRPWDNFDYTRNDASSLPVDPSTASWAVIQQHKEMLRRVLLEAGMVNGGLCGAIGEEDFPSLETPMPHGESSGSHAGADVAQH